MNYNWIRVNFMTPERVYLDVKTSKRICRAKLYIQYVFNQDDHYEWMCPNGYIIPEAVNFWNQQDESNSEIEKNNDSHQCEFIRDSYYCDIYNLDK